jgi:hypothetical protein
LAEILSMSPDWCPPTAKVKAIVGIGLALQFAHSFGLIHHDSDHRVQMASFGLIGLEECDGIARGGDWSVFGRRMVYRKWILVHLCP